MLNFFKNYMHKNSHHSDNSPDDSKGSDSDLNNNIKSIQIRKNEPVWKGLKRKYIFYALIFIALTTLAAVVFGLEEDKQVELDRQAKQQSEIIESKAVSGDHLMNIPKDYTAQAEEARKKEEAEKRKATQAKESNIKSNNSKPPAPAVPKQPDIPARYELSPAEKARLIQIELRQKALESPIGFELKNKEEQ